MKSPRVGRALLLALALLGIASLLLLAAGLGSVEFREVRAYRQERAETVAVSISALLDQIAAVPIWKVIVVWVGTFLIVLLLSSLLPPEIRKRFFRSLARWMLFMLAVFLLLRYRGQFFPAESPPPIEMEPSSAPLAEAPPMPEFVMPNIPPALIYMISVVFLLMVFGILWMIGRSFIALRPRQTGKFVLDELAVAARLSLDELSSADRNWEDAIVRCYARMSAVVQRRQGLRREIAMTPSEFASHLTRSGLPADAVQRLTRLFESVRYGARSAGERERAEASACLSDILRYCGEAA
jgi:hypothetical protein